MYLEYFLSHQKSEIEIIKFETCNSQCSGFAKGEDYIEYTAKTRQCFLIAKLSW